MEKCSVCIITNACATKIKCESAMVLRRREIVKNRLDIMAVPPGNGRVFIIFACFLKSFI